MRCLRRHVRCSRSGARAGRRRSTARGRAGQPRQSIDARSSAPRRSACALRSRTPPSSRASRSTTTTWRWRPRTKWALAPTRPTPDTAASTATRPPRRTRRTAPSAERALAAARTVAPLEIEGNISNVVSCVHTCWQRKSSSTLQTVNLLESHRVVEGRFAATRVGHTERFRV